MLNLHGEVMKGHSSLHVRLCSWVRRLLNLILTAVTANSHIPHQAVLRLPSLQNVNKYSRQGVGVLIVLGWAMLHESASLPLGARGARKGITRRSVALILAMSGIHNPQIPV